MSNNARKVLIGGEWIAGSETISVRSPHSDKHLADVAAAGADDREAAIDHAVAAAKEMRKVPKFEIAAGLRRIAAGITARREEFIASIVAESAKPVRYARGEVDRAIATFTWAAGEAERFVGEIVPIDTQPSGRSKSGYTLRVARGVIYGITPFNFPLNLVAHKVAPALASGNSIIIKPSDRTPLTSLLLGEVFVECGLPKAALQVVPMDVKHLEPIYSDERVKMISFTGSDRVGWQIKEKAVKKFVTLELGGNASVIVDETADFEDSLKRNLIGAFAYSGQVCISVQRVFVHEKHHAKWLEQFAKRSEGLQQGDPADENTELGVMIDEDAAKRAEEWINEAADHGARLVCAGKREGKMLSAAVLTNTTPEMRVVSEEAFAPLAVVEPFARFEDAVEMANHGRFGLQCGVFTRDLANTSFAAENLEYGGVIINDVPTFRVDNMPYGGVKDSGFGREGIRYAMEEMTEIRLVVTDNGNL